MLTDGLIFSIVGSLILVGGLYWNPRIFLSDYPADVRAAVPPKTRREWMQALALSAAFFPWIIGYPVFSAWLLRQQAGGDITFWFAFACTLGVVMLFNAVDLFILDIWLFATLTPRWLVIPGTAGMPGYKDRAMHLRAHAKALPFLIAAAAVLAWIALWIPQ